MMTIDVDRVAAGALHRAWRRYYQNRAQLLLPAAKAVSPKDMYMLREALDVSGYTRLDPLCTDLKDGGPFCNQKLGVCKCGWTAYEECTAKPDELKEVLKSSQDGPDSKTLGAFMVYEKDRANLLVTNLLQDDWPKDKDGSNGVYSYRASYRYIAYRKPDTEQAPTCKMTFPASVAKVADNHAVSNAIEIKTSVKKTLNTFVKTFVKSTFEQTETAIDKRGRELRKRRCHALGAVLFDMREMLCLSRDTFAVATSRVKRNYLSAVHLLPLSLVGSQQGKPHRAKVLVTQHGHYLSAPTNQHINVLADKEDVHDLSVVIVRGGENLRIVPFLSADGNVCHLFVEIPESKWQIWAISFVADPIGDDITTATATATATYSDYQSHSGFSSFQTEVTLDRIGYQSAHTPDQEFQFEIERTLNKLHPLLVRPLALALTNARRLAILHWLPEEYGNSPGWKACLYVMRRLLVDDKMSDSGFAHVGVALLSLLSADDYEAWIGPEVLGEQNFPRLVMAVEPYLGAIAEIEVMGHLEDQIKLSGHSAFDAIKHTAQSDSWFSNNGTVEHNFSKENWQRLIDEIRNLEGCCIEIAEQLQEVENERGQTNIFESFKGWLCQKALTHGSIALICWIAGEAKSKKVLLAIAEAKKDDTTKTQFKKNKLGVKSKNKDILIEQLRNLFRIIQTRDPKHSNHYDTSQSFTLTLELDGTDSCICIVPSWKTSAFEEAALAVANSLTEDQEDQFGDLVKAVKAAQASIDIFIHNKKILIK